jgi:DNA-binding LacI/PurR family transcriptional regulator
MDTHYSLEALAKAAGVSKTTVSLILNGKGTHYRISAVTDQRVRALAAQFGFKPDFQACVLRTGRSSTFGLVVSDITNHFSA